MQVLKDEIRHSILRIAKESFLESGFEKTSMKDIAGKVGVAVGNLYRYFPNKEALFDAVVTPAHDKLLQLVRAGEQESSPGLSMIEQVGRILGELLRDNRESLLILLYRSAGTKLESAKEQFVDKLSEHVLSHLEDFNRSHSAGRLDMETARPVAVAFLEGYFEIIRLYSEPERIDAITRQYVSIWFTGLQALLPSPTDR